MEIEDNRKFCQYCRNLLPQQIIENFHPDCGKEVTNYNQTKTDKKKKKVPLRCQLFGCDRVSDMGEMCVIHSPVN